jgi:thioredoxin 1
MYHRESPDRSCLDWEIFAGDTIKFYGERLMSGVQIINDQQFGTEVLSQTQPVVVYFWADWCGPCKLVSPSIDWIATNYADRLKIVKMPVDGNPESVKAYAVEGVPALRLFQNGQLIHAWEGAITKAKLVEMLDRHFFTVV